MMENPDTIKQILKRVNESENKSKFQERIDKAMEKVKNN